MALAYLAATVGCRQWPSFGQTKYLCVRLEEVHTSIIKTEDRRFFPKCNSTIKPKNGSKFSEKLWVMILRISDLV
jgi:hypothetical protein